jgi:phosphoribosylglycinamide formyltransferase-1
MPEAPDPPLRLAVLLSGGGTTMQNLAEVIARGELNARIALVLSSNPKAYGVTRAAGLNLPCVVVPRKEFADPAGFSVVVFRHVRESGAELVCLAGFLSLLAIPADYAGKVLNIHPALLPSFGGLGMHGRRVHEAVLAAGCKVSGCTVHFATPEYDAGPILVQRCCPVLEGDTPETLAARVLEEEHKLYPLALKRVIEGRVRF